MGGACETFRRDLAIAHLDAGRVVVLAGGTGNPFFTTDTSTTGLFAVTANSHPALGDWDGDGDLDIALESYYREPDGSG